MTSPVVRRWAPILAVVVLLPLTLGVTFQNDWVGFYATQPSQPVRVEPGEPVEFAGTTWQVTDVSRVTAASDEGAEIGLPDETLLLTVAVRVTPDELVDGLSPYCMATLQELDGDTVVRNWDEATFSPIDYSPDDPLEWGCDTELTSPYSFEAWFVVPDDVGEQLSLSLDVTGQRPQFLRLLL